MLHIESHDDESPPSPAILLYAIAAVLVVACLWIGVTT